MGPGLLEVEALADIDGTLGVMSAVGIGNVSEMAVGSAGENG